MKKIFYEKRGRRYYPVSEYDSGLVDALPRGAHLILVYPGGRSTRYNVDPNRAAMIAAGRVAEDAISNAIMRAQELRLPQRQRERPLTLEQREAWENLVRIFGDGVRQLEWPSVREAAEAGVQAMEQEAEELLAHPTVRKAYERFLTVCRLVNSGGDGA